MTDKRMPLGGLATAHYGKALKKADRDESGSHVVYGSCGPVGRHTEPLTVLPTIVIGRKGSVGEVTYAPRGGWPIDTAYYLELFDSKRVHLRYLYWALRSAGLHRRAITTSIPGLNRDELYRTQVFVPSLSEQQRIAGMLDISEAIQRKREGGLDLLDQLLRSAFVKMFGQAVVEASARALPPGWRLATVESIASRAANSCAGGPFGSTLGRKDYRSAGVPVIRGNNLVAGRGEFREEGFVFVTPAKAHQLRRNVALPGDVIFTQRGTLGQVAQIPLSANYDRYIISQSQMKVTVNRELIDPTYLVHYFLSPRAEAELALRTVATGIPHINLSILKNLTVVLPPLSRQRDFSAFAAQHATTRKRMGMAHVNAEMLARSLANSVFERQPPGRA